MLIKRNALALICLAALVFSLGCTTINNGVPLRETPITIEECPKKLDVHRLFGAPDNIFYVGEMRYMSYSSSKTRGGAVGLGQAVIPVFMFSKNNVVGNAYIFEIDSNDSVTRVFNFIDSPRAEYEVWPFGE